MKFSEKMTLLFNKKNALRVTIFTEDKRVKRYVVVVKGKTFNIENMTYTIEADKVHYFKGLPYLAYKEDSLEAIDPSNLESSVISPEEYYAAIDQNILLQLMRYATKGDQKLINMILISGASVIGVLGLGLYFLFDKVADLNAEILALKLLLEQIINSISISGGF